jgi:hypothetical protein
MIFSPEDEGPYWMTPEEREQKRKDQYGSTIIQKEYTKPQLIEMLEKEKGIVSAKGNRQQIWDMAQRAGTALTYEKREIIQGWEGQPKGMEQILWEQGWIDPMVTHKVYTVHGTKDSMGAVRKDTTSLQYLMSNLKYFESQETMLCLKARRIVMERSLEPSNLRSIPSHAVWERNVSVESVPQTTLTRSFVPIIFGIATLGSRHCCPAVTASPNTFESRRRCSLVSNRSNVQLRLILAALTTKPLSVTR